MSHAMNHLMKTTCAGFAARAALAVAALCAALPAAAQAPKVVIKLGWATSDVAEDSHAIGARAFKKALEAEPGAGFDVQLYPNRQIGDEKQLVEGLRLGTVDAAVITNGVYSQVEPAFQLNDLPFLYTTEAQVFKVLDGDVGKKLTALIDRKGIVMLGYMAGGYRHMLNNKRPVFKPDDVVGVKYRVHNSVAVDMYTLLNAGPVPMAWGETLTALQQGAVDGMDLPIGVIDSLKVYEAVKFMSLTGHTYSMSALGMSKRKYDQLSAPQKAAVGRAAAVAAAEQRKINAANEEKLLAVLKGKGLAINPVADKAAFRARVLPVYEKLRPNIGSDLLDATLAAVK